MIKSIFDYLEINIYVFVFVCFLLFLYILRDNKQIKELLDKLF